MVCDEDDDEGGVLTTPSASEEPLELADGLGGEVLGTAELCTVTLVVKVLPAIVVPTAAAAAVAIGGIFLTVLGLLQDDTISIGCWGCVTDTVIALCCGTGMREVRRD